MLDISGSVVRELEEETGLAPGEYESDPDWHCIYTGPAVAMIRMLRVDMPGEALRERIVANLASQREPELSAIHVVRGVSDLTSAMPRFVTAFLEAQFASLP
jgi:8-oxo-dGTP pyrophosphatase MutT (NUDIX family)